MDPSSPPVVPGVRQSLRDLQGHLQHLQSLYEDVQAQVVAQTPGDGARRRATDPGSPAALRNSSIAHLRSSLVASPVRSLALASAGGPTASSLPPAPAPRVQSPPGRLAGEGAQAQAAFRRRTTSTTAACTAAPASAGASTSASTHQKHAEAKPLDSYQRFAAQVFEERFCPLRLGLQQQPPLPEEGGGQQLAAPPVAQKQQRQGPQVLSRQQQQPPPQQQQQPPPPQQQQEQQQHLDCWQERRDQQRTEQHTAQQVTHHQQHAQGPGHEDGSGSAVPCTPSKGGRSQLEAEQQALQTSLVYSSGGSVLSYASEEGDAVLLASPAKGIKHAPAAPAAAQLAVPGMASQQQVASPLPLLEAALQLLSSPAKLRGGQSAAAPVADSAPRAAGNGSYAGRAASALQQQGPWPALPAAQREAAEQGATEVAAPASLRPQRLAFDAGADLVPAAIEQGAQAQCAPQGCSLSAPQAQAQQQQPLHEQQVQEEDEDVPEQQQDQQQQQQQQDQQQQQQQQQSCHGHAAQQTGVPPSAVTAHEAAAAGSSASFKGGERPCTASARAQALLRLKQRRQLQQGHPAAVSPPEEQQRPGSSNSVPCPSASKQAGWAVAGSVAAGPGQVAAAAEEAAAAQQQPVLVEVLQRTEAQAVQQCDELSPRSQGRQQDLELEQRQVTDALPVQQHGRGGTFPQHQQPTEPQHQQQQQQQEEEEEPPPQPRPFLRRRSQMVPMQKLPDWSRVRPRTSTRWSGSSSSVEGNSSRPTTAGGLSNSTPVSSRVGTPMVPVSAATDSPHPEQARPGSSRFAGTSAGRRTSVQHSSSGRHSAASEQLPWERGTGSHAGQPPSLARVSSRGSSAAAAAAALAAQPGVRQPQPQPQPQPQQQRPPWGARREQAARPASGGSRSGGGTSSKHVQEPSNARTTPFAPRPNSGAGGRRPRGTPLYDASSLLPLNLEDLGLLYAGTGYSSGAYGGSAGSSVEELLQRSNSTSTSLPGRRGIRQVPSHGGTAARPATAGGLHAGAGTAAAVGAAAGDCGPLDDLLSQVDRMLHQVERAIS